MYSSRRFTRTFRRRKIEMYQEWFELFEKIKEKGKKQLSKGGWDK